MLGKRTRSERAGLVLLLLLLGLATQLRFTTDLRALFPPDGPLTEAMALMEAFGLVDAVLIEVDGSGMDRSRTTARVEAVAAALQADPRVSRVDWRADPRDGLALQIAIAPLAVRLLPAETIAERTTPQGVEAALTAWLGRLALPMGGAFKEGLRWDPLDLTTLAGLHVQGAFAPYGITLQDGYFFDASGERALMFARVADSALAVGPGDTLVEDLEAIFSGGDPDGPQVRWFGGHRVASASAQLVRADILRAFLFGGAVLSAVLFYSFRNPRATQGAVLAPMIGMLAAAAAGAFCGPLHALTMAFCASIAGISADYWVHLYAAASDGGGVDRASRRAAGDRALREILPSLLLSAGSTAAAFAVLSASEFPLIAHLGILGCAAILGALAGTVLLGPWIFSVLGGPSIRDLIPTRIPRWLGWGVLALTLAALAALPQSSFDGDPRNLNAVPEELQRLEAEFGERYGAFGNAGIAVVEGQGLDQALDRSDRVVQALSALEGVTVSGVDRVLPGPARVQRRLAALPPVDVLQDRLDRGAEALGIKPSAVAGVSARLRGEPPAPLGPETWAGTPVGDLVSNHVRVEPGRARVMSSVLVEDAARIPAVVQAVEAAEPGAQLVMGGALATRGVEALQRDALRLSGYSLAVVLAVLALRYRRPRAALAAAVPSLAAVAWAGATMVALDRPWNAVSGGAMVLVFGLGLDYGVFVVDGALRGHPLPARRAVAVGLATSVAGAGALLTANNPAIFSFGLVMSVGLGAAGLVALAVSPLILGGAPAASAYSDRSSRY